MVAEASAGSPTDGHSHSLLELYLWLKTCVLEPHTAADLGLLGVPAGVEEAALEDADIERLLTFAYIRELFGTVETVKSTVRVFTVLQDNAEGSVVRRVIFCPDGVNSILIDAGFSATSPIHIPNVDEQKADMRFFPGALCADGTAFYTQFDSVGSGNFIFSCRGRLFSCASICTGQRQCVCLAQLVLEALRICTQRFFAKDELKITNFIDNVRFAGTEDIATHAWELFRERAARCNLTFEVTSIWSTTYVFLGIAYDHIQKTAKLGPKSLHKLSTLLDQGLREAHNWKMSDFISAFGLLIWANTVLAICPAAWYTIFKFVRRRGQRLLDEPADIWPCLYRPLRTWIAKLQSTSATLQQAPSARDTSHNVYVYSDACPAGYGVIIFAESFIFISAGHFNGDEVIFILEARAFLHAVRFLVALRRERRLDIFSPSSSTFYHFRVDNTSAIGAVNKGRSYNFTLNSIVAKLHSVLSSLGSGFDLRYVRSADNLSDPVSRLVINKSCRLQIDVSQLFPESE